MADPATKASDRQGMGVFCGDAIDTVAYEVERMERFAAAGAPS